MDYPANFNQDKHHHKHRKRKKSLLSFWGGNFDLDEETDDISAEDLSSSAYPLSLARTSYSVWIVGFAQKGGVKKLLGMGLAPGMQLEVVSAQPSGSVIVAVGRERIGLGAGMANKIMVSDRPLNKTNEKDESMSTQSRTYLREMPVGTIGKVLGYEKTMGGYKGKLLSMGLTPKTQFKVIQVPSLGDPVVIEVQEFNLSLRKQEADALIFEIVEEKNNLNS